MDEPVHLQRIDPERNMRRFYAAEILPTLFGGVSVVRRWGRIGGPGRVMLETFDHAEEARAALTKLVSVKQRRGYRIEAG
ncbi:WGR domain-containing protein [Paenirhodobacter populi]|uniref:WGR domain-containing protein n=1 Tax=Paenirhodobacter populi TaxID=2306993 RepID=A0A443JR93_9RHOB|nr:WGR domain-containing protein [Sinirhodobacter populi]RWR23033.1 WGR domain-containing protein [Sinirhodobacter populi]